MVIVQAAGKPFGIVILRPPFRAKDPGIIPEFVSGANTEQSAIRGFFAPKPGSE
jgi:hypothetical protein